MNNTHTLKLIIKLSLFAVTLILGTLFVLNMEEQAGLARVDLADVGGERIVTTADEAVLYANIDSETEAGGLYRSSDNGRTWENIGLGPETSVNVLAVDAADPAILYAGGLGGSLLDNTRNLWRSLDGGQSWEQFRLNLPASADLMLPTVTAFATNPMRPYSLYVGTEGQGVYRVDKSYPGYELVGGTSLYNGHVKSLLFGANDSLFALTDEGLFVTSGETWQAVETPETFISLAADPADKATLYGGGASMGVYRSTDNGQNWALYNEGLPLTPGAALRVTALAVDEAVPGSVAIATAQGLGSRLSPDAIYRSENRGEGWTQVAPLDGLATDLALNKGIVHATTSNGLQRYSIDDATGPEAVSLEAAPETETANDFNITHLMALLLTIATAVLILTNPMRWVEGWREQADQ